MDNPIVGNEPIQVDPEHDRKTTLVDSLKKATFIVGSSLICFIAARNTVAWYFQKFWQASDDFWQATWTYVHTDIFGGDEWKIVVIGTTVVTTFVYWVFNALLMIPDCYYWPAFLIKYRVQDGVNDPVDPIQLRSALKRVLFNQIAISGPISLVYYRAMVWRGARFGTELPSIQRVLWELTVCILVEEILFYYGHRLLHHPRIYKYIHKIHHEWTAPIGIVSLYAHPLEHLLSNILPPMLGPLLLGSHIATAWLWFTLALVTTTISHSGYHFPFFPSPEAHDYHHLKFNQNFGVLGVLDRLHGTDQQFRKSVMYERHFMMLTLQPVKEMFPSLKKKELCKEAKEFVLEKIE